MKRIALYHLETLLVIARLGTFHAAAERLGTTQPAISARIREMESQLSIAIFRREGRRMVLTARGRQLVQDCEPLWAQFESVLMRPGEFGGAVGVVRVGSGEIAAASILSGFTAEVESSMPGVTLEVEIDLTAKMLQQLLAGTSDMVFLAGPVAAPGLRTAPVGDVPLAWLAGAKGRARLANGAAPRVWSLPQNSPLHTITRDSLQVRGITAAGFATCNNVRSLIDIVVAGEGVAVLPLTMVGTELARGALQEVWQRPDRRIRFEVAIRSNEPDPVIRELFERASRFVMPPVS
ncbi:MAG: LysR family transcriptional regulator [Sphingomonadaceae bacterium]|nr:LysR family transcriptional regulator [Sphingomonadaceae bacterium]